jgi:multidrug efflux system membrane fusion protein
MTDTLEPFQKPVRSQGRYLLAGLAILIAAWGGYVGWQHHSTAKLAAATESAPSPAIPVSVATAQRRDVPIYLAGLGTVQAFNTVMIKTRVDGELIKVAFTEGQDVKAGDLLGRSIHDRFRPRTIKQ